MHYDIHALGFDQAFLFHGLEHTANSLAFTTDDTRDLLTRDVQLHAVGVGLGIGLVAQLGEGTRNAAGDLLLYDTPAERSPGGMILSRLAVTNRAQL